MDQDLINIVEDLPKGGARILLEGFPDVGLVGFISVSYMIEKLEMKEIGYIDSELLPPLVVINDSKVRNIIRLYHKDDIAALISEIPIPLPLIRPLGNSLIDWCKGKEIKEVISISGIAEPNRLDIDVPKVLAIASNKDFLDYLTHKIGIEKFDEGYLTGFKAELLKEGAKRNFNVALLLAQAHFNYPDPGAAAQMILSLSKLFDRKIDVTPLLKSAEMLKVQMRDLMRRTNENLIRLQKSKEMEVPPVYV
ncbi:MAG: PAC2 family protein [Nitrososphaerales archaeon]